MADTFIDFIRKELKSYTFDDPKDPSHTLASLDKTFTGGNYALNATQFEAAEKLGQELIDYAKKRGVNLMDFPDIRKAMGYDTDPNALSAAELGCYVMGVAMAGKTSTDAPPFRMSDKIDDIHVFSALSASNGQPAENTNADLAVALGQQVFGDSMPGKSSVDTSTQDSLRGIISRAPTSMKC